MQGHDLAAWLHSILPPAPHHLPLIYHTPARPPRGGLYTRLVLSITPTPGVYSSLTPDTALFLHRPWGLDRRRLPRSTLVLASHQCLDELLTTGHNEVLMRRLGVGVMGEMRAVVGYKNDPERRMGLVGLVKGPYESRRAWRARVEAEFGGLEGDLGCSAGGGEEEQAQDERQIKAIACMNAFEPDFLRQVTEASNRLQEDALIVLSSSPPPPISPHEILYITGETKALGRASALEVDMPTLFVGHRRCEQWAIEHLAEEARREWGGRVEVVVVVEPEEARQLAARKGRSAYPKAAPAPDQTEHAVDHPQREGGGGGEM